MQNIGLVFPGQGSQYIGMCKTLFNEYDIVKQTFEEANDILGFDIANLCFNGSIVELNKIDNMLLSILISSVAAYRVFECEIGITPILSAGHSLGEYSALVCSGAIKFSDALRIVKKRSLLAESMSDIGTMTVVNGVYKGIIEDICKKVSDSEYIVSVACYNSPDQTVISGHKEAVIKAEDELFKMNAQITPILMTPPFHSYLLQPAAEELSEFIKNINVNEPKWKVISNVTALPHSTKEKIKDNILLQMTMPVQWIATMDYMENYKVDTIIEIGPKAVLSNLVEMNGKKFKTISFGQNDDRQALFNIFKPSSGSIKYNNIQISKTTPTVITRCLAIAVCTRNYNWNDDEYVKGVEQPYEKIEKLQQYLEENNEVPSIEQMNEALEMLRLIFVTKKTPIEEQRRRFNQIFNETNTRDLFKDFIV